MSTLLGYVGIIVAMLAFGSNFTIVRKYNSGDGFFFQLFMCMGIWTVGFVVNLIQGAPKFYPFAMLGGALWASGNVLCIYVIQEIGMALGLIIWGSMALLVGWFTGFFGLFGLEKDDLNIVWLNVLGVCFGLASLLTSFFVRVDPLPRDEAEFVQLPGGEQVEDGTFQERKTHSPSVSLQNTESAESASESQSEKSRFSAIGCALVAGFFFGNNFDPPTYIQQHNCSDGNKCDSHYRGASSEPLDYVFAHFCGIIMMSMFIFMTYTLFKKNEPWVNRELCLPAYLSGAMWALGQVGWFVANSALGYTVAFPLVVIGPGIIGSMWDVFIFKRITGFRNLALLGGVFFLAICCATCIVLSR
mmetsp:Transcript_2908/g.6797  ORF Transcript_2908/g.6797 Transcript_2908/m.6797 type:complete len:359 (-) Transcript_2908:199-1275(-)